MARSTLRWIALATSLTLLTACAGTGSSACPRLVKYEDGFAEKLADEIEAAPPKPAVVRVVSDYYVLRRQVEACQR